MTSELTGSRNKSEDPKISQKSEGPEFLRFIKSPLAFLSKSPNILLSLMVIQCSAILVGNSHFIVLLTGKLYLVYTPKISVPGGCDEMLVHK